REPASRLRPPALGSPGGQRGPRAAVDASSLSYGFRRPGAGSRIGAQPAQHAAVVLHWIVQFRRLDNLNHRGEARVAHDLPEGRRADRPFRDPLVTIQMRPTLGLGVVEV